MKTLDGHGARRQDDSLDGVGSRACSQDVNGGGDSGLDELVFWVIVSFIYTWS
jgi:hypothetical protein